MPKLPVPIRVPDGLSVRMTQPYANTSNNAWYAAHGVTAPFHNGIDLVLVNKDGTENHQATYGAPLITPSDGWQIVKVTFDSAMSTKGNGVTIESPEFFENGKRKKLQVVFWHCSEVIPKQGKLPAFTDVAYCGNSGVVTPPPTPYAVFNGSHLHLMLFEFTFTNGSFVLDNYGNGVNGAIDPLTRFSLTTIIHGPDSDQSKDLAPFAYFLKRIADALPFATRK